MCNTHAVAGLNGQQSTGITLSNNTQPGNINVEQFSNPVKTGLKQQNGEKLSEKCQKV